MQFSKDGEWYQVVRITGPAHNLLALKFGEPGTSVLIVDRLSISNEAATIDGDDVQLQILEGVAEANTQLGTSYVATAIRFVTTDTASPDVYRFLARTIVEHKVQTGTFAAA